MKTRIFLILTLCFLETNTALAIGIANLFDEDERKKKEPTLIEMIQDPYWLEAIQRALEEPAGRSLEVYV